MSTRNSAKPENRHERTDRIAREILLAERAAREKKIAHLRALRQQREQNAIA